MAGVGAETPELQALTSTRAPFRNRCPSHLLEMRLLGDHLHGPPKGRLCSRISHDASSPLRVELGLCAAAHNAVQAAGLYRPPVGKHARSSRKSAEGRGRERARVGIRKQQAAAGREKGPGLNQIGIQNDPQHQTPPLSEPIISTSTPASFPPLSCKLVQSKGMKQFRLVAYAFRRRQRIARA